MAIEVHDSVRTVTDPQRCPKCPHGWHGLACNLRWPAYTAPNGSCPCPSSLPVDTSELSQ